jgi:N-acetylneuraminic acid mutarotase
MIMMSRFGRICVVVAVALGGLGLFAWQDQDDRDKQKVLQEIQRLVMQLDDDDPRVRRQASKNLEEIGKEHFSEVHRMARETLSETKSLEVRRRLKELLLVLEENILEELPEAPIGVRYWHNAVAHGSKIIIWGGCSGNNAFKDGAILDLNTKRWEKIPKAPLKGRYLHRAVLSDHTLQMVIWGGMARRGDNKPLFFNDGAIYDIRASKWEKIPKAPVPGRVDHSAVLWDSKLVIWGGRKALRPLRDGAIFDLKTNKWQKVPRAPIKGRTGHCAVLYDSKLVIWGGKGLGTYFKDGAIFDLKIRKWERMPRAPVKGRTGHSAALYGSKLVIWGGRLRGVYSNGGAIFDLKTRSWEKMPDAPVQGRDSHSAALCGSKFVVWGGRTPAGGRPDDGAIFDFKTRTWRELPEQIGIAGRYWHSTVVCGSTMVIWGGAGTSGLCNDGLILNVEHAWILGDQTNPAQQDDNGGRKARLDFEQVERLIAQLDAREAKVRQAAQKRLSELAQSHFTQIVTRARKELSLTRSPEVRRRLRELLSGFKEGIWQRFPEAPIAGRYTHSAVLWGSKLVIWGGLAGPQGGVLSNGAILDLERFYLLGDFD